MGLFDLFKKRDQEPAPTVQPELVKTSEASPANDAEVPEDKRFVSRTWVPAGHFYSPIADEDYVRSHEARLFDRTLPVPGVDLDLAAMRQRYQGFQPLMDRLKIAEKKVEGRRYFFENPAYSYGDGVVYASLLDELRPKRVIEVGSGYSSCLLLDMRDELGLSDTEITFIEPYPELLQTLMGPDEQRVTLIPKPVQEVDTSVFEQLEAGDILFIDSTHVSKIDSDVNHHLFRILPSLKSGVYIHFHDIFYPFEYPREWLLDENRSWNENYILRAFLMHNSQYEVVFFNSAFVNLVDRAELNDCPTFIKNSGGAIWLRKL